MKKSVFLIVLGLICFLCVPSSYAVLDANYYDDDSVNQTQGIKGSGNSEQGQQQGIAGSGNSEQGQQQGIAGSGNSKQGQGQTQGQIGINKNKNENDQDQKQGQGQGQGQDQGQGQAMGQGQFAVGAVNVEDNSEYKSYSFAPPALHAQKGTSSANMYSIFGGIGLSQTEEYTIAIEKIATIERLEAKGYLTKEEARREARQAYADLDSASQPKRVLGIFGQTRGKHLLNGLGLLAWDSFYVEGQKPFSRVTPKEATVDTEETYVGNEGNI